VTPLQPLVLAGRTVRLVPLSVEHAADLMTVATPELFQYASDAPATWTLEDFQAYVQRALASSQRLPFTIVLNDTNQAIGTTSYGDIRLEHRGLEIGWTWIAQMQQGTAVNPEIKYLMLQHAFEVLGMLRVQLKCDGRNVHSQRAITKLGATREGVLRKHVVLPDGFVRDTVMFSITDDEWPQVKAGLEQRLGYVLGK